MPSEREITDKFWRALKDDRILMLSAAGDETGEAKPMTGLLEDDAKGPVWIFTSTDTDLAREAGQSTPAIGQFASKDHHLFATVHGALSLSNDRAVLDRLWSPVVDAWYDGKDDPKLALMRFDLDRAHVWLNDNSIFRGAKIALGADPKEQVKDQVADVRLR